MTIFELLVLILLVYIAVLLSNETNEGESRLDYYFKIGWSIFFTLMAIGLLDYLGLLPLTFV